MMLESTDFNVDHWSRFTEAEFIEQCMANRIFEGCEHQRELLQQAYKLIHDAARITEKNKSI
jgi:hypothetical protein